ncbi:glycosyltransferase family 61 protein [Paraburkholderia graminis]|uniref:glycosyltransferase family 61 protein n=1 Tax=Paraburkholderia graminis TaxID=60548 RepID=UPI00286C332E|nr:glycosyltransferase 61 family protein [Paraburkholderia graminis]
MRTNLGNVDANPAEVSRMELGGDVEIAKRLNRLFLRDWYLAENPDVAEAGIDPFVHFMEHGAAEGRRPSPYFDVSWYLDRYSDVRENGINPLLHYIRDGAAEGRNPNPYFDSEWYATNYADEMNRGCNPLLHFVEIGEAKDHRPSLRFDAKWYRRVNPDIDFTKVSAFAHFLLYGEKEGRAPSGGDNHFARTSELAGFLSSIAPATKTVLASVEMDVTSIKAAMTTLRKQAVHGEIHWFKASAEGKATTVSPFPGEPYVAHLHNVRVVAGTRFIVSDSNLILHDEEAAFGRRQDAALKYHRAKRLHEGKLFLQFNARQAAWIDSGISVMHEYSNNYFHFVAETLPRIVLIEESGIASDVPILYESNLHRTMLDLLKSACPKVRPLLTVEPGTMYFVKELYQPSDVASIVDAYEGGDLATQAMLDVTRIRKAVAACKSKFSDGSTTRRRKIFAGRSSKSRQLLNQQRLESELARLGFEILRCEDLDLATQIRIFNEAEIVIAPTGAQVTNMVWGHPGTRWIVLASDHPHHQLYLWELLGKVSGAAVEFFQGPRAFNRDDRFSVHDDYTIDVKQLLTLI